MAFAVPLIAAAVGGLASSAGNKFFSGSSEKHKRVPTLRKEQMPLYQQAVNAGIGPGAGGAFGTAADYYRNLLSDQSADIDAFAAPQLRQFNQDILPNIAEQFAGFGAGGSGLSGSGFRNAAIGAGTDLAERLGAIRANLRQSGAQGLSNIGQVGLGNFSQDVMTRPGSQGFLSQAAPGIGNAIAQYGGNWLSNSFGGNNVGANTSPYGNQQQQQNSVLNASYGMR